MSNALTTWAVFFLRQGFTVIPMRLKVPLVRWKDYQSVPPTEEVVRQWFDEQWPDAGIGILTGPGSGLLVLDVDGPNGIESLKGKPLPKTWTVKSRKGYHYYYAWPKELDGYKTTITGLLGETSGLDVRGKGGYVVAPPSLWDSGRRYSFLPGHSPSNCQINTAPDWLIAALKQSKEVPEEQGETGHWLEDILGGVGEGGRHEALVKLAGYYFARMHPDLAEHHLIEWNEKNTPPIESEELKLQIADLRARFKSGEYKSNRPIQEQPNVEVFDKPVEVLSAAELMQGSSKIEWLIDGLVPACSTTIFGGWNDLGKSWVMTDLSIAVARGEVWLNRYKTNPGTVLYINNENAKNLVTFRLEKLVNGRNIKVPENLHFIIRQRVKLTSNRGMEALKELLAAHKPALTIIDSFASAHTLDENISKDMRYLFDDLVLPLCDEYKTAFIFVDHEGKGGVDKNGNAIKASGTKRLRGSSAKSDAADVVLSVLEDHGTTYLEHSKARYGRKQSPLAFSLDDITPNATVVRSLY